VAQSRKAKDQRLVGWGREPHAKLAQNMAKGIGQATVPAGHFFSSYMELFGFVNFVAALPRHVDDMVEQLDEALGTEGEDRAVKVFQRGLDPFRPLIAEVMLTRAVDSYLTYVTELLTLVFRERPETLRSKATIRVDFALGFDSLEELRAGIAEEKVDDLAYRGMAELAKWVEDALGFALIPERGSRKKIERLVEKRNLIVHHRGVIDNRYIRQCGARDGAVGDSIDARDDASEAIALLAEAVWDADRRAAEKWKLKRRPLPTENRVGDQLTLAREEGGEHEQSADPTIGST
jgi:hypothetical protein